MTTKYEKEVLAAVTRLANEVERRSTRGRQEDYRMTDELAELVEGVVLAIAGDGQQVHPRSHWWLLEKANDLAAHLDRLGRSGGDWRSGSMPVDTLFKHVRGLVDPAEHMADPGPEPKATTQKLESLEELESLPRMTDRQICVIYGWEGSEGQPDLDRLRQYRAQKPEDRQPVVVERPPVATERWPERRVHPGTVEACALKIEQYREEDAIAT